MKHAKTVITRPQCAWCDAFIDEEKLRKTGMKRPPKYCNREHAVRGIARDRKQTDFFQRFSKLGNAAQMEIKKATGKRPGFEKRSVAVAKANHDKPKRKRKAV